ncbi:unnamed protein product (macronuclear) [Paramecium tetraurelia]|uniref:Uncharacterized protein n=1 Tax=Paramecium tetraurelia TaxID=5888 RepID=A0E194_PARTE|nr:uncharacterized protein GSPATT00022230001 [Paramecium tetraurelia]CAK89061.1 unnamed protein product [Paramecium tetraurelia]|eukprot:XP_001456458.1 hypothetical protein (macronuclear) [Paramecium tetraurelia strain d4-2]
MKISVTENNSENQGFLKQSQFFQQLEVEIIKQFQLSIGLNFQQEIFVRFLYFLMGNLIEKLKSFFSTSKLEVCMVGLENVGKTTMLNQLSMGDPSFTVPTVGLNVRTVKKGGVTMKIWDIGGQVQYRPEWGNYAQGCDAIIFLVDTSNQATLGTSKKELHNLLDNKSLRNIPLLVIGNKIDVNPHLNEKQMIEGLNLDYITSNAWAVAMCSALTGNNITQVVDWLITKSKKL